MITLCMDTAHKYMGLALIKDGVLLDSASFSCFKKQSEMLLPEADHLLKKNGLTVQDVNRLVITKGPGSYTGVRIAMTVAKTLGAVAHLDVYVISTLRLYTKGQNGLCMLDARSQRAYCGIYNETESEEKIMELDEVKKLLESSNADVFGDGSLVGLSDRYEDIGECFVKTESLWEKVDNIHTLVPSYFKGQEGYKTIA